MSKVGIIQIHEQRKQSNSRYCCICFRPSSERRLVEPTCLKALIYKLAYVAQFKEDIQVCYVCEALARSATQFVKAVELAARVSELFVGMTSVQWGEVLAYLRPGGKGTKILNQESPQRRALRLDGELRARRRFELFRTDTLVVSGGGPPARAPASALTPATVRAQTMSKDIVVIMQHEDPLSTVMPVLQPMLPVMSPIMLPASTVSPMSTVSPISNVSGLTQVSSMARLPAVTSNLPQLTIDPDRKHMRVLNKDTNDYILHPIVTGADGSLYVPSLQLQLMDNGVLKSVDSSQMQNRLPTLTQPRPNLNNANLNNANLNSTNLKLANLNSTKLIPKETNNTQIVSLDSVVEKSEKRSEYYKFLVSQMEQKSVSNIEVIKMDDLNIVLNNDGKNPKKRKLSELEQTLSEVAHILEKNAQGGCEIKYEVIDDDEDPLSIQTGNHSNSIVDGNHMTSSGNQKSSGNQNSSGNQKSSGNQLTNSESVKEPVLRSDRTVDWEDKIPMDVISFMDATDPNPQERIMQPPPMGVISDVRSVPDVPDIECIDLC